MSLLLDNSGGPAGAHADLAAHPTPPADRAGPPPPHLPLCLPQVTNPAIDPLREKFVTSTRW